MNQGTFLTLGSSLALTLGTIALPVQSQDENRTRQDNTRTQYRQSDRTDVRTTQDAHLKSLKQLEGTWRVSVNVKDQGVANTIREGDNTRDRNPASDRRDQLNVDNATSRQIESTIRNALSRAGGEVDDINEKAEELTRAITREHAQNDLDNLRGTLQSALEECGMSEERARTESVGLAQQVQQMLNQPSGQANDQNRTRSGQAAQQTGAMTMNGYARRHWDMEGKILVERFHLNNVPAHANTQQPRTTVRDRDQNQNGQDQNHQLVADSSYSGFGFFCYDQENQEFDHVWADNQNGGVVLSSGNFNQGSKTFEFVCKDSAHTSRDYDAPSADPKRSAQAETVKIRIVNDDKHILEMSKPGPDGNMMAYTITYERASWSSPEWQRDEQVRTFGNDIERETRGDRRDTNRTSDRTNTGLVTERIQSAILTSLVQFGAEYNEAADDAKNLAKAITREHAENDLEDLPGALEELFEDHDVDEARARTEAAALARKIREMLGN